MLSAGIRRSVDWMEFNLWLSAYPFKEDSKRMGIAIELWYISKAEKNTSYVGIFV